MRVFMTGATGFIGGHVARQLVDAGNSVVALVRDLGAARGFASLGVVVHEGDLTDKESMRPAMRGADAVLHIAAWYKIGLRDKSPAERINVEGTRNVLELMRELDVPRGVYTSTLAVFSDTKGRVVDEAYHYDGPHLSEYDRTKWLAHYRVALPMIEEGLPLTIVQPGLTYGPGDLGPFGHVLRQYLRRRLPILARDSGYCWAHVEDTARRHVQALEKGRPGESYIIAGPPHTLPAAFDIAEEISGLRAPKIRLGPRALEMSAALMALAEKLVPLPQEYNPETLRVAARATYYGSSAKAERELGFSPRPLEEGLAETIRYELKALGTSR